MKRGVKPTHLAEHEQRFEGARTDSWAAALDAFASLLGQPPWTGASTRVVIADHWARYAIVPWVAALNSAEERLAHGRSEEHTSELQSRRDLVCRLLLEKKKDEFRKIASSL